MFDCKILKHSHFTEVCQAPASFSVTSELVMQPEEPSIASLLVKQSPSMHYGHGWIMGKDGKRWHPCISQDSLLADLSTSQEGKSWLSKVLRRLFH